MARRQNLTSRSTLVPRYVGGKLGVALQIETPDGPLYVMPVRLGVAPDS